jgi:hypothetical protein
MTGWQLVITFKSSKLRSRSAEKKEIEKQWQPRERDCEVFNDKNSSKYLAGRT